MLYRPLLVRPKSAQKNRCFAKPVQMNQPL
jgi:hypothetical protein